MTLLTTLPRPIAGIRISPFANGQSEVGRFLVECGNRSFVVSEMMQRLLCALMESDDPSRVRASLEYMSGRKFSDDDLTEAISCLPVSLFVVGQVPDSGPFLWRTPILSGTAVDRIARCCRSLFTPTALVVVCLVAILMLGLIALGHRPSGGGLDSVGSTVVLLALILTALGHEFGHATACSRFGVEPGPIGFGLYVVFPVFYADVTRAWRLPPLQRAWVDLGGLYFQVLMVLLLAPLLQHMISADAMWLYLFYNAGIMVHNLNPFFKLDGYWLFSDLARIPNLHKQTSRHVCHVLGFRRISGYRPQPQMALVLPGYALLSGIYFTYLMAGIPAWMRTQFLPGLDRSVDYFQASSRAYTAHAWIDAVKAGGEAVLVILAVALPLVFGVLWLVRQATVLLSQPGEAVKGGIAP